ncbi:MAG: hypothetical protein A3F91_09360 [Flavobacteria bacterium RIFCSPLOWO2_12_FULL_35_11]|nr:MAG: hypothetical protein A3F91_09360 [Flavobacteria bacterium RIFCSPLOWO2_12_FULL_35_11]
MKKLILTEKIDAGCQVAEALWHLGVKEGDFSDKAPSIKSKSGKKGYLVGGEYTIVWTNGHLGEDLKAGELKEGYALNFSFDSTFDYTMPSLLSDMKRAVKAEKRAIAKQIKEIIAKNSFDKIYICTDGDAEGERIAHDALFEFGGLSKKSDVRRMWVTGAFNTAKVVEQQLNDAKPYDDNKYKWLLDSQRARSSGDYIQGMKSTKVLVDVYGAKLYSGRVKNTIVGLIGDRELEIKNFKPKSYYVINGSMGGVTLNHFFYEDVDDVSAAGEIVTKKERTTHYFDVEKKNGVVRDIEQAGLRGVVSKYETKRSSTKARPLPLSGDDFKSIMAKEYGLSLEDAGNILQYLRDEGFTTYQGTNGRFFSKDEEAIVKIAYNTAVAVFAKNESSKPSVFSLEAGLFDDAKAKKQNHPPLHLTDKVPSESDYEKWASSKLPKVKEGYELIAKRILVHFLEKDIFDAVRLEVVIAGHKFDAIGVKPLKQGWREFIGDKKANSFFEVELKEGASVTLDKYNVIAKETTKPKLYNEQEILETLMNVSKVLNSQIDEEADPEKKLQLKKAKNILKDVEGIGTDRTRETILKQLSETLLKVSKKEISLTADGWTLYNSLPEELRSVLFTAVWEEDFEKIRRGELSYDEVVDKIDTHVKKSVRFIIENADKSKIKVFKPVEIIKTGLVCPVCSSEVVDSGEVFKCEKNLFKDGKQKGCKFMILKNQKLLGARFNTKLIGRLLNGEVLTGPNGNSVQLDLENSFFTKIIYAAGYGGGESCAGGDSGELVETEKTYRLGNKFCFKEAFGKKLSKAEATKLLKDEEVTLKRVSKAEKEYKVTVWLEEGGKLGNSFG